MSFANLKKNSKNSFEKLSNKLTNEGKGGFEKDERYWEFKVDQAGNGQATIRFLPAPEGEEFPYNKIFEYAFKDKRTGRWYIEASRETLGEPDPVNEKWAELWNAGLKEEAKQYPRSTRYISNILVIKDKANPENEGKRFLWKYGPRIFQKLQAAIKPEFDDKEAFDPFDLWKGANFKLRARLVDKQRNYDASEFEPCAALFDGDDKALEKLYNELYPLLPETAPDKFKPYDQLKTRFLSVIGGAPAQAKAQPNNGEPKAQEDASSDGDDNGQKASAPKTKATTASDDDDMDAFRKLLEDN